MYKIIFAVLVFVQTAMFGQAWVKDPGKFYLKAGVNSTNSDAIFTRNETGVDTLFGQKLPHLHELVYQIYGQYGLVKGVNLIGSIPVKSIRNKTDGFQRTGIADLELGATFAWKKQTWQITPALFVGIPTGYYKPFKTSGRIFSNDELILGDGEWNVMPRIYFGKGLSKAPVYITGFTGFNYRTMARYHEIDALIESGYTLGKFILILKLQLKKSLNSDTSLHTFTGLYDNGQEYLSPHFSLYYKHTANLHFSCNIGGAIFARYAQYSPSINLGVAYEK